MANCEVKINMQKKLEKVRCGYKLKECGKILRPGKDDTVEGMGSWPFQAWDRESRVQLERQGQPGGMGTSRQDGWEQITVA